MRRARASCMIRMGRYQLITFKISEVKMKKIFALLLFVVLSLLVVACGPGTNVDPNDPPNRQIEFTTPGPNPEVGTPTENGPTAGLGTGLFHGLISVIT